MTTNTQRKTVTGMYALEIKPGTRCACHNPRCPGGSETEGAHIGGNPEQCSGDAVRMVTVENRPLQVPMCEACAAYHEQKAGA